MVTHTRDDRSHDPSDHQHDDSDHEHDVASGLVIPGYTRSVEEPTTGGVTAVPRTSPATRDRDSHGTITVTGIQRAIRSGHTPSSSTPTAANAPATHPAVTPTTHPVPAPDAGAASIPHAPTVPATQKKKKKRALKRGWIPDQHGAWAMLIVPFWVGVYLSTFRWTHVLLFVLWMMGYCAFFAAGLWLRSGRKARYWPPLRFHGAITVILGILTLIAAPPLFEWAVIFLPLVVIATWQAWNNSERSLLSRTVTVIAAGLMTLVAYDMGTQFTRGPSVPTWLQHSQIASAPLHHASTHMLDGWPWAFCVTFWLIAYFWSTVPFVKTVVRERGKASWKTLSIATHVILLIAATISAYVGWTTWWFALCWVLLVARAIIFPAYGMRATKPGQVLKTVGKTEIFFSLLVYISLLA